VVSYPGQENPGVVCGWPGKVTDPDMKSSVGSDNYDSVNAPQT
jgi:hypothetical protein